MFCCYIERPVWVGFKIEEGGIGKKVDMAKNVIL